MTSSHKKAPPFLLKTHQMLSKEEYRHIIHWNDQENGFVIADPTEFSLTILPTFFKHKNMHSYIRQLNMYGFSKKRGRTHNYYHHPSFVREQPELISEIKRKVQNKGTKRNRESVTSIDLPNLAQQPQEILMKMNYFLLVQQIANLQMILQDLPNCPEQQAFQTATHAYTNLHYQLLQMCQTKQNKPDVPTASSLTQERQVSPN